MLVLQYLKPPLWWFFLCLLINLSMTNFTTQLKRFGSKGEKTGWTYIDIPEKIAQQIKPNCKKSFRVKGKIDNHLIRAVALTPIGEGNFILAVNAEMRKAIKKNNGASVQIKIEEDAKELIHDEALMLCLKDEPAALDYFRSLPQSHQNWFSNWVKGAKTQPTVTKRLTVIVNACTQKMSFSEMMKSYRDTANLIQ